MIFFVYLRGLFMSHTVSCCDYGDHLLLEDHTVTYRHGSAYRMIHQ